MRHSYGLKNRSKLICVFPISKILIPGSGFSYRHRNLTSYFRGRELIFDIGIWCLFSGSGFSMSESNEALGRKTSPTEITV